MTGHRRAVLVLLLIGAIAPVGCATTRPQCPLATACLATLEISERLYFGGSIPRGGEISDADWAKFLAEVVTPRFPAGFTVLRGEGQWRGQSGEVVREKSFIIELNHADTAAADRSVEEILVEYKRRFAQEAVLRMRQRVDAGLY